MDVMKAHFARVQPIVGQSLTQRRVAVWGMPEAEAVVRFLAASGVARWWWPRADAAFERRLAAQHAGALRLEIWRDGATLHLADPDLLIGIGTGVQPAWQAAQAMGRPALLAQLPSLTRPCTLCCYFPGESPAPPLPDWAAEPLDRWGWRCAAPLVAGVARAMLLRGTPYERPDLAQAWASGQYQLCFDSLAPPAPFQSPPGQRGTILLAGLGSLGSVAALALAGEGPAFLLADPDRVDPYNPVRQGYLPAQIGQLKAEALRDTLYSQGSAQVEALPEALRDAQQVGALLDEYGIGAALVATGTSADFVIARALRARDIPHVVGRCYPRARYWEAIVVDGADGPAFDEIRGHLRLGPTPPPTPEQRAAYSEAGALEAEPATLIESGWAALWMARLIRQCLTPAGLRERWFLQLLHDQTLCLIGGVGVEPTEVGPAYGVARPGEIHAWGRAQIRTLGQ